MQGRYYVILDFGAAFLSKHEYFEDFLVLLPRLGKHAVLRWFMKKEMIVIYKHCEPVFFLMLNLGAAV